eukprot:CAMPEP_0113691974 /NCGR_PEP_ID=MMETSP0038_2-20120614/18799_1 /TAXON_ID=2898 /ORGANISM="Cryptomonas paramecium" /LENGTH=621 /DNA_ID=CAMNT_0000613779 /DNA_START=48 /DNA_END=1910 /DNA_ORIENTATION=- /assembly_acc=CAM_ASM_000170
MESQRARVDSDRSHGLKQQGFKSSGSNEDVEKGPEPDFYDMYNIYSRSGKRAILLTCGLIAFISPFTDTVYLPVLPDLAVYYDVSDSMVAITVSAYLGAVGVGQLFFGPLSDRYGRLVVIYAGLIIYEALTVACIFAPTIQVLIVLRTLEGFVVSSSMVAAQSIITDIFPAEELGSAMGAFFFPLLVGPIVAPMLGGAIAQQFHWQSTFMLLAALAVPIALLSMAVIRHETHHWFAARRLGLLPLLDSVFHPANDCAPRAPAPPLSEALEGALLSLDISTPAAGKAAPRVLDPTPPVPCLGCSLPGEPKRIDAEHPAGLPRAHADGPCVDLAGGACCAATLEQGLSAAGPDGADARLEDVEVHGGPGGDAHQASATILVDNAAPAGRRPRAAVQPPRLLMPWEPLAFMFDLQLAPYFAIGGLSFAVMFTTLTVSPIFLAKPPYSLNASEIGLTYIPIGICMLAGSFFGGTLSDASYARLGKGGRCHDGRLTWLLPVIWIMAAAAVGFGLTLQHGVHLAGPIVFQSVLGFGDSALAPAITGFLGSVKPDQAGAAGSVLLFLSFAGCAVIVSVAVEASDALGVGVFFAIIAAIVVAAALWATVCNLFRIRRPLPQMEAPAEPA